MANKKFVLGTGVGGALVFALAAGWIFHNFPANRIKEEDFHFIHCPSCNLELPNSPSLKGSKCPKCEAPKPDMVPTVKRLAEGGGGGKFNTPLLVVAVFLFLVCGEGVVYGYLVHQRARENESKKKGVEKLTCRCPFCHRKFRYPRTKVGSATQCPQCKTGFTWPAESPEDSFAE